MTSRAATRFVRPEVLSRISSLDLLARGVVEGFVAGLHRSPYKGFSVDFMEYRPYIPGDDPLRVDWKAYARTDRLYVKEFEDETNTHLDLLLDTSGSMGYASGPTSKLDYARYLAASLAYLLVRQRDAVGLTLFDHAVQRRIPPRSTRRHLHTLLREMERAEATGSTAIGKPLHELAGRGDRRGFVVLISDLLGEVDAVVNGLKHFRYEGHEVILFQILDPQEVAFEFTDFVQFEDLESGQKMLVQADEARKAYRQRFKAYTEELRRACGMLGIDYTLLTTDQPLDFALFNYLAARRRKG